MRATRVTSLSHVALWGLPLLAGCVADADPAAPAERTGSNEQAIVSIASPVSGPSTGAATPPSTGMNAVPASAADGDTSAGSIHFGRFSNGADLAALPSTDRAAWRTATTSDVFSAPPALATHLDAALARADVKTTGALTTSTAEAMLAPLAALFDEDPLVTTLSDKFNGFPAARYRWLNRAILPPGVLTVVDYPDPQLFREARLRGARMFCSAREMQRRQAARGQISMGERALATLNLFGHTIDLMAFEPTLVLDGPERFTGGGANDGAQAFVVPMLVGSKITPIGNVGLPGLPEVRAPVAFVTADGEVRNNAQWDATYSTHRRRFQTGTHADAIVSRQANVATNFPDVPLFTVGPIKVELNLDAQTSIGTAAPAAGNKRVLGHTGGTPFGLTARRRTGFGSANGISYGDMPLQLASGVPSFPTPQSPTGNIDWSFHPAGSAGATPFATLPVTHAMLARAIQDDDHTLEVQHSLGLIAGLDFDGAVDLGILHLGVEVSGDLIVNGGQVQELRDAIVLEHKKPVSMLTSTPRGFVDAQYQAKITLIFKIGPFDLSQTLVDVPPTTFARSDTPDWPEIHRFRMGTGSSEGAAAMTQPAVSSHLPLDDQPQTPPSPDGFGAFPSFPTDVATCLADTTPNPPTPALCPGNPAGTFRPAVNVCVTGVEVAGVPYPANVCADQSAYHDAVLLAGFTAAQAQCAEKILGLVCAPVSFQSGARVSHVFPLPAPGAPTDPAELEAEAVQLVIEGCEAAFGPGSYTSLLEVGACDANAEPIGKGKLFSITGGDTTIRPSTCG